MNADELILVAEAKAFTRGKRAVARQILEILNDSANENGGQWNGADICDAVYQLANDTLEGES